MIGILFEVFLDIFSILFFEKMSMKRRDQMKNVV